MENFGKLPTWAPRVKQHKIRILYENDAQGILDEALLAEVGWALHARCESFISAVEASRGRAPCPNCGTVIHHQHGPEEILHCPACGWANTWKAYFKTFQHKQLSGAEQVLNLFHEYTSRFPQVRDSREKMLLIDMLLHGFHSYIRFGNTRAVCVNLIEGTHNEVVEFLDRLEYGPGSTPGLQQQWQEWRSEINLIHDRWKSWKKTG